MGDNDVTFVRPQFDLVTEIINTKISPEVVEYARKRLYSITDLYKEKANKTELLGNFIRRRPTIVFAYSHGSEEAIIGPELGQTVFDIGTAIWFNGKIVVIQACLTGKELAPALVDNGARAVFAYDDTLDIRVWAGTYEPLAGFKECINKPKLLLDGLTAKEVYDKTIEEFNKWIDYWDKEDPVTADILRHDRDAFKLYGTGESRIGLSMYLFVGLTDVFVITWLFMMTLLEVIRLTKPLWRRR